MPISDSLLFFFLAAHYNGNSERSYYSGSNFRNREYYYRYFCHPDPCQNGGHCIEQYSGYDCMCPAQYTGPHCEGELFLGLQL